MSTWTAEELRRVDENAPAVEAGHRWVEKTTVRRYMRVCADCGVSYNFAVWMGYSTCDARPAPPSAAPEGGAGSSLAGVESRDIIDRLIHNAYWHGFHSRVGAHGRLVPRDRIREAKSHGKAVEHLARRVRERLARRLRATTTHLPASEGAAGVPEGGEPNGLAMPSTTLDAMELPWEAAISEDGDGFSLTVELSDFMIFAASRERLLAEWRQALTSHLRGHARALSPNATSGNPGGTVTHELRPTRSPEGSREVERGR